MRNCQFKTVIPVVFLLCFFSWSCTKIDTTQLGQDLIPVVDNIHTFDTTFDVIANNIDEIPSTCDSVPYNDLHTLGIINNDPLFGNTSANIYVEFKPLNFPFSLPVADTRSLDSAVLILHYSHSFGDSTVPQKVQVYNLTDPLRVDSIYSTCALLPYDNFTLLGETSYTPKNLNDSIHAFREDATNELRIKISNSFALGLLDSVNLVNDTIFKQYLKGFAIIPDQSVSGNSLSYFDLNSADSRLSFYVRSSSAGVKDTTVYNYTFTNISGSANALTRTRGNAEITNNISHPPAGNDFVYIQTSPGSYANLTIPGLESLSNRVIHRAELIAEQDFSSPSDKVFAAPAVLYLEKKDFTVAGNYLPIPCDFTLTSQVPNFSYFGGVRKTADNGQGNLAATYTFNISRYVQSIVTKKSTNDTLRLRAPYHLLNPLNYVDRCGQGVPSFNFTFNDIAEGRVKLNGTNKTAHRLRLHIVYSIL